MSTSSNKKYEATMDDVLALISDFKAGNFSKQLNKTSDPKLKDLVDSLNDVAKILAAQTAQAEIDIIERKQAEKEKETILKRLKYALDASGDGIWDWTPADGQTVYSKAWIEMIGYEVGELASLASEWSDRLHPDDIEWVFAAINKVTQKPQNGDSLIHEYRFRNKAGDYLWIMNKVKVVERNEKGEASRVVGTHTDITERKAAEKLLSESEERIRRSNQLLESSQAISRVGGWELDLTTKNLYWTAETYRIHETSPEEFNPTVDAGVGYFLPDSKRQISEALELAMTKGVGYDLYLETYTTKWRKINVRTTCVVTFVDEKPTKLTGIFQDITELTRLQEENRFILDALGIGLWKFNPVDQSLFWDQSMYQLFDIKEGDFSGHYQAWESTLTPKSKAKAVEELEQALRGEKEFDTVFEINTKNRGNCFISGRGKVIRDNSGNPLMMYGVNLDVTNSRVQELQLAASKAQLEKAETIAKIGSWELNLATYLGHWSKGQLTLFGLDHKKSAPSFEEFMGFVHPDDRAFISTEFENILKNKVKEFQLIFRIILQDGKTVRWVKEVGELLLTQDGTPDRLVGTIQDITEEKLSGDRIEGLKNQLEMISDNLPGPISQLDRHGRYVYASKMYFEYFGKTPEQVLGKTKREVLPPNIFFQSEPNIQRALSGERVQFEMPFVTASGKQLFVQINMIPFIGQDGKPDGFITVYNDITAIKEAESKLLSEAAKQQEEKLNEVMRITSATPSCLKIITAKGRLVHMNPQGLSLIEADNLESVLNANVYEIIEEAHREAFIHFNEKICSGEKGSLIFEIVGLKGTRHWMETFAAPYTLPNGEIGHVAITNRITDRVNSQKELDLQRNKLLVKSKLESLGEMSAGVAHEINNPLAIISGSVGLLSKFSDNPEKFAAKIETIQKSCDRIARIVGGLRKFSRSGDKTNLKKHQLSKIIQDAFILTDAKSQRHLTPLTFDNKSCSNVLCDDIEIEQVLVNLINNSIDAIKDLPEKWVKISLSDDSNSVVLRVTDAGSGIPESIRDKLFEPFFTTKKVGEGTGLGLSITKGILDEHKATITVDPFSANTCFEIRFPRAEEIKNVS